MDKNIKRNRNYEKTEHAIKEALIKLYKKRKTIDKITVKELCETANISRSTFYLHYCDLISIFEAVGDKFVISLKEMIMEISYQDVHDFLNFINKIFSAIDESSELIRIGISSEQPLSYIDNLKNEIANFIINTADLNKVTRDKDEILVEIRIIVAGLFDFIITLLRKKPKVNLTDYSEIINNFLVRWSKTI